MDFCAVKFSGILQGGAGIVVTSPASGRGIPDGHALQGPRRVPGHFHFFETMEKIDGFLSQFLGQTEGSFSKKISETLPLSGFLHEVKKERRVSERKGAPAGVLGGEMPP